jgi:hypothetical protein
MFRKIFNNSNGIIGVISLIGTVVAIWYSIETTPEGNDRPLSFYIIMGLIAVVTLFVILFLIGKLVRLALEFLAKKLHDLNVIDFAKLGVFARMLFHKDNIAVRAVTMQTILETLSTSSTNLEDLGYKIGENCINNPNYGNIEMPRLEITNNTSREEAKKAIEEWLNIDTAANWGKFSLGEDFSKNEEGFSGCITVNECFLLSERMNATTDLIPFLLGYCKAIIKKYTGHSVMITESAKKNNNAKGCCKFEFEPSK